MHKDAFLLGNITIEAAINAVCLHKNDREAKLEAASRLFVESLEPHKNDCSLTLARLLALSVVEEVLAR